MKPPGRPWPSRRCSASSGRSSVRRWPASPGPASPLRCRVRRARIPEGATATSAGSMPSCPPSTRVDRSGIDHLAARRETGVARSRRRGPPRRLALLRRPDAHLETLPPDSWVCQVLDLDSAVADAGADVLVVQGSEAGGHGRRAAASSRCCLPSSTRSATSRSLPPAGSPLAASSPCAARGAGVALGTRLYATHEAADSKSQAQARRAARDDTMHSTVFDRVRDHGGRRATRAGRP